MKCPLLRASEQRGEVSTEYYLDDCLKEDCAWWSKDTESCAILAAFLAMAGVGIELEQLRQQLPSWRQFATKKE